MTEQEQPPDETAPVKKDWQIAVQWLNTTGFRILIGFAGVLTVGLILLAVTIKDTDTRANVLTVGVLTILIIVVTTVAAVSNRLMVEIMDRQETEMTEQRKAMQKQGRLMRKALKQSNRMFYASERAYIGTVGAYIEPEGTGSINAMQSFDIPDTGRFRFVVAVKNEGNTPASNFGHVFRMTIVNYPIKDEPPPFGPISQSRTMPQIIPHDAPQYFRGSWMEFPEAPIKAIKAGDAALIVSCKFVFETLGAQEEIVADFVWLPDDKLFTNRRDFPFTDADDAFTVYEDRST